jgi:hypothetical protein
MGCCPFWKRKKVMAEENQEQFQVTIVPMADDPQCKIKILLFMLRATELR